MYKLILLIGICSAFASGSKLTVPDERFERIVNCFYSGWEELISDDTKDFLHIDYIDLSLCTHITYCYIELSADAFLDVDDTPVSINHETKAMKRFSDLRKKKPHLRTIVALAASADYSTNSTEVFANPILREKFVNTIVKLVKKYEFNGLDIHCQYHVQTSADQVENPSHKQNLVLLLKALREKFDKEGLILSVTVGATEDIAKVSYNIEEISKYVDFINLRTYDFDEYNEPWKKVTHPTPLYPSSKENAEERKWNIDYVVKYWISQGAPPRKLILGTSFRGSFFILANPKIVGRGAPSVGVGGIDAVSSIPEYYQICGLLKNPEWRHLYDKEQEVPYIYKQDIILAYDDVESIQRKAEYVNKMNLGGVFADSIEGDDFNGNCGEKFPLLKTLNRDFGYKC